MHCGSETAKNSSILTDLSLVTVQLWLSQSIVSSKCIERAAVCERAPSFQLVFYRRNVIYRHNWKNMHMSTHLLPGLPFHHICKPKLNSIKILYENGMQIQRNPERKSCCLSTSHNFAADFLQEAMHDDGVRVSALRQFWERQHSQDKSHGLNPQLSTENKSETHFVD